jgi:asparagine synthase (glutamine-hydrolysing)
MQPGLVLEAQGWTVHGVTHARGQAFDAHGRLLRAAELAALFDALPDRTGWLATAAGLNGCFAAVGIYGAETRATVDRLRTLPLFFARCDDRLIISDAAAAVTASMPHPKRDPTSVSEFRLTGYVTGARTLIDGLYQIRAGHCLFLRPGDNAEQGLHRYYEFRHGDFFSDDHDGLIARLVATHERVFRRLLSDIGSRPIVLPLSGGYDSRLIGVMLRDLGCRDVLCYCYGAEDNWESKTSRELAAYLGFRWTMVPYSAEGWRKWAATRGFADYFRSAGNLASIPHVQDWPAVHELHERGDIPNDAVFVPGHTGDFVVGGHVPKWYPARKQLSRDDVLQSLFDAHYSLWDWPADDDSALRTAFADRIERIVGPIPATSTPEDAASTYECWEWQERQAKFIVNSVRVYESFGYAWRVPLFDAELMDYWSRVPLDARVGRRLYFEFVARHQKLPVTRANNDYLLPISATIRMINQTGLRPLAKRAQRVLRRARWRRQYEGGDMRWFALVDPEEFRSRYTGREIGHSFFAVKYLESIAS